MALSKEKLLELYQKDCNQFHGMILLNHILSQPSVSSTSESDFNIVYNNDGYEHDEIKKPHQGGENRFILGAPLSLDNALKTPIGYNVLLPKGDIENVIVKIYGGTEKKDARKKTFLPGSPLSPLTQSLLRENFAVVFLNLNDLLELEHYQHEMPEAIYKRLSQSIEHFLKVLKQRPETLHPELLKTKSAAKYILMGCSFGGIIAVRQAQSSIQSNANLFDLHISYNGGLDRVKFYDADLSFNAHRKRPILKYLNPADPENMENLCRRVLVVTNQEDNNVPAKSNHSFINKANKAGKSHLVSLYQVEKGNRMNSAKGIISKGHYLPDTFDEFSKLLQVIFSFVREQKVTISTPFYNYVLRKKANRFYPKASPKKLFIAQALPIAQSLEDVKSQIVIDWDAVFKPIFDPIFFLQKIYTDSDIISTGNTEIRRLHCDEGGNFLLNDECIRKVILAMQPGYTKFLNELYDLEPLEDEIFIQNDRLFSFLKCKIISVLSNLKCFSPSHPEFELLYLFYKENQNILPNLIAMYPDYEECRDEFRQELISTLERMSVLSFSCSDIDFGKRNRTSHPKSEILMPPKKQKLN